MSQKRNSKWRPPPSWIYFRWLFLTSSRLSTADLKHHIKFRANISIGGWLKFTFQNSRWRPSAILDFRKSNFWPMGGLGLLIFHHGTKFGTKMLIDDQIMAQKQNSKWRPPPSLIYFRWLLWHTAEIPLLISITTQDLVPRYLNRQLTYGNFWKFKMAAVRHLGIVVCSYKTTNEASVLGHISLSNFMSIRCIDLKIWGFNFFCRFGLKCLFTPPKFGFLGVKSRKTYPLGKNDPLGTNLHGNTSLGALSVKPWFSR